jgi:hypothetical protein
MHSCLWLIAASPALRLAPPHRVPSLRLASPVMQLGEQGLPVGNRFCGGAVPFAPLGEAGGGSTATRAALLGQSGAVPAGQTPRATRTRGRAQYSTNQQASTNSTTLGGSAGAALPAQGRLAHRRDMTAGALGERVVGGDKYCGGSVPFAPVGSAGGGSTANAAALSGRTGAVYPGPTKPARASSIPSSSLGSGSSTNSPVLDGTGAIVSSATTRRARRRDETAGALGERAVGGDKYCGGAVPFAPIGTAGGGSTANAAALSGRTGAV